MRNHNNKELRTCFKENFNNTWQQHWKLKIKKHPKSINASSSRINRKE